MKNIHLVFHVVKLHPAVTDPIPKHQARPSPLPVIVDDEEHFEVEAILDSCIFYHKLQYKVKWKGYDYEEASWESSEGVNTPLLVKEFYDHHPNAAKFIWGLYSLSPALFQSV